MRHENSSILELDGKEVSEFTPSKPREKWLRKRTHVKIRVGIRGFRALRSSVCEDCFHQIKTWVYPLLCNKISSNILKCLKEILKKKPKESVTCVFSFISLTHSTERDCQPPCKWRCIHRRQSAGRVGSLHVWPSGHGHFGRGKGKHTVTQTDVSAAFVISVCVSIQCLLSNSVQVDLHIMTQPPSGEWVYFNTEVTNSSGRVSFTIPEDKRLGIGVYPVKMVVRWVPVSNSDSVSYFS